MLVGLDRAGAGLRAPDLMVGTSTGALVAALVYGAAGPAAAVRTVFLTPDATARAALTGDPGDPVVFAAALAAGERQSSGYVGQVRARWGRQPSTAAISSSVTAVATVESTTESRARR
ncbi:hypothetical protein [Micromonospora sp. LOL_015]|uniref:hypothetical protein n=1 Tax=Micromonospora sp. LOL_015 TaxID=3345416 RepID=UPI003A85D7A5